MKLDTLHHFFQSVPGLRNDANESLAFARQLEYVYREVYETKYPDVRARDFIPVNSAVDPGAETYLYRIYDSIGEAKLVDDYASDFPNIELAGAEVLGKIVSIGDSYQYSLQDLRRATMLGIDVSARKAVAARHAIERKLDIIAAVGAPNVGGLASNTSVTALSSASTPALAAGTWASRAATTAGSQSIINDLRVAKDDILVKSKGLATGRNLLLPLGAYAQLSRPVAPDNGFNMQSIREYLLDTGMFESIDYWYALDTAGPTAAGRGIIYDRSPDLLSLIVPVEFEQVAPQAVNMSFKVSCHMRTGGVEILYPFTMRYLDGVNG